jgi:hypothetical protein
MALVNVFVLLFGCLLCYLVKIFICDYLLSPLRKIPAGHITAHISGLWILYLRWSQQEHGTILNLHQRYGPIVRLGPKEISISSEEGLHKIYTRGLPMNQSYTSQYSYYK